MTETAKAPVRCGLSGTALKYIACITMLIDHIGASCIEAGILLPALAAGAASCGGIPVSTLLAADRVLRYIGRLAFPIFCFLAVEGPAGRGLCGRAAAPRWRWLPTPTTTPSACSSSAPCT